ncbi:hypothetical protein Bbelb_382240 [Branchiostoma belcheri]|nr:hypothetical protein Bbelb_382240 [Branchiostoma belcheri]
MAIQADSTVNDECDMEPYAVADMSDHEAYLSATTNVRQQASKADSKVTDDGDMETYAVANMSDHEAYLRGSTNVCQQASDDSSRETTVHVHKLCNPPISPTDLLQNPMYSSNPKQANKLHGKMAMQAHNTVTDDGDIRPYAVRYKDKEPKADSTVIDDDYIGPYAIRYSEKEPKADSKVTDDGDMETYAVANMSDHEAYLRGSTNVCQQASDDSSHETTANKLHGKMAMQAHNTATGDGDMEPYAVANMFDHESYLRGSTNVRQQTTELLHKLRNPPHAKKLNMNPMYIPNFQQANKLWENRKCFLVAFGVVLLLVGAFTTGLIIGRSHNTQGLQKAQFPHGKLSTWRHELPSGRLTTLERQCAPMCFHCSAPKWQAQERHHFGPTLRNGNVTISVRHRAIGNVTILGQHRAIGNVTILGQHRAIGNVTILGQHRAIGNVTILGQHRAIGNVTILGRGTMIRRIGKHIYVTARAWILML